ncbi:MAG TPA: radical SAM protein [Candidatus Brocadiia bacterium]|nr:radical SAM protein [Candidatus Brocadiia bacterium]
MRTKKLVLVYPPVAGVTSAPLGIASLKGYVEKSLPQWSVRCLDFNLRSYEKAFDLARLGRYPSGRVYREGILGEIAFTRAGDVFRGKHDEEFYTRPDRYSLYADLLLRLMLTEVGGYEQLPAAYRGEAPMPEQIEEFAGEIAEDKPDALGISICYNQQTWTGLCIAKRVKEKTGIPVVFGGTFFRTEGERFLNDFPESADFVIAGEGELALAALLSDPGKPESVPSLTWREGGKARTNPISLINELDDLGHPDFSDLDMRRYFSPSPVAPVLSSRGCYWRRCAFCVHYKSVGQTYRSHGMEFLINELKSRVESGIRHFSFVDEMVSPKRFQEIADAILDAGLDISYYALAKPVRQFDEGILERMSQSGCRYLLWGLESGSQRVLDFMDKGTEVGEIQRVFRAAHAAGIINHVFVMPGFPTETKPELAQTLRFLENNQDVIYGVHRGLFHLMKGSPVFDDPERFGIAKTWPAGHYLEKEWHEFECSRGMSRREAEYYYNTILPYLSAFNVYSLSLGHFRDHALLIYEKSSDRLRPESRRFPLVPF